MDGFYCMKKIVNYMRRMAQLIGKIINVFFILVSQNITVPDTCNRIQADIGEKKITFYNAGAAFWGIDSYERIPGDIIQNYGRILKMNNSFSAGKTIRFCTNASYFYLKIFYDFRPFMTNMSSNAASGLDVYSKCNNNWNWVTTVAPENGIQMHVKKKVELGNGEKEVIIYLPSYSQVKLVLIGIPNEASVKKSTDSSNNAMVFYGSSITQGCAASRAGLSFPNIISRYFNIPVYNFGFSESAKGEKEIIEYVAGINASIFIIEYDHNASIEELERTHINIYKTIRNCNTNAWIIFMSRFSGRRTESLLEEKKRISIIYNTVLYAHGRKDSKVFFLNGKDALSDIDNCFADDRHPNDLGMAQIAKLLINIIEKENCIDVKNNKEYDNEFVT